MADQKPTSAGPKPAQATPSAFAGTTLFSGKSVRESTELYQRLVAELTPERFAAQMEMVSRLEAVIDRNHARLVKLQAERSKKAQASEARRTSDRLTVFRSRK